MGGEHITSDIFGEQREKRNLEELNRRKPIRAKSQKGGGLGTEENRRPEFLKESTAPAPGTTKQGEAPLLEERRKTVNRGGRILGKDPKGGKGPMLGKLTKTPLAKIDE